MPRKKNNNNVGTEGRTCIGILCAKGLKIKGCNLDRRRADSVIMAISPSLSVKDDKIIYDVAYIELVLLTSCLSLYECYGNSEISMGHSGKRNYPKVLHMNPIALFVPNVGPPLAMAFDVKISED
ncbi:hypothetical protein RRG08_001044 [Elysia crispata]|uniref:Uncharacterized protein n=1 Tax=Elysia crispata TaxID=231223 RepID=A0AAE1E5F1_9GAST|nr:hypothetical protein RRG08_001044 [Elysia crispata]